MNKIEFTNLLKSMDINIDAKSLDNVDDKELEKNILSKISGGESEEEIEYIIKPYIVPFKPINNNDPIYTIYFGNHSNDSGNKNNNLI